MIACFQSTLNDLRGLIFGTRLRTNVRSFKEAVLHEAARAVVMVNGLVDRAGNTRWPFVSRRSGPTVRCLDNNENGNFRTRKEKVGDTSIWRGSGHQ